MEVVVSMGMATMKAAMLVLGVVVTVIVVVDALIIVAVVLNHISNTKHHCSS